MGVGQGKCMRGVHRASACGEMIRVGAGLVHVVRLWKRAGAAQLMWG